MQALKRYPFKRVVFAFSLCPGLVGVFAFGFMATDKLILQKINMNVLEVIFGFAWAGGVIALGSIIFFGIPAAVLGMGYAATRLYRCWHHILFITGTGSIAAWSWGKFVIPRMFSDEANLFLGAATSILMAFYALPKKNDWENGRAERQ